MSPNPFSMAEMYRRLESSPQVVARGSYREQLNQSESGAYLIGSSFFPARDAHIASLASHAEKARFYALEVEVTQPDVLDLSACASLAAYHAAMALLDES